MIEFTQQTPRPLQPTKHLTFKRFPINNYQQRPNGDLCIYKSCEMRKCSIRKLELYLFLLFYIRVSIVSPTQYADAHMTMTAKIIIRIQFADWCGEKDIGTQRHIDTLSASQIWPSSG